MKKSFIISIFLCLATLCTFVRANAQIPEVVINEIQITIGTDNPDNDFIELYNTSDKSIDITDWRLEKTFQSGNKSEIIKFSPKGYRVIIPANGSLLWTCNDGTFKSLTLPEFTNSNNLSNNYSIALFNNTNLIDAITYGSGPKEIYNPSIIYSEKIQNGQSIERNLEKNLFFPQKYPSPENNAFLVEIIPENLSIRINEVFPNPAAKGEDNEYIELYNFGNEIINISNFILRDASKSKGYTFPAETKIKPREFLVIYKSVSKISLNNTEEQVYLLDDNENLIDSLEYSETKEESSFGFDEIESKFRWSKNLTPGEPNAFEPAPSGKGKIPKKSYKNFPTEFSASGSTNYAYSWDFGDGSRSKKQKVTHTYKKTGKFKGFLIIDNGTEEKKIDFEIKIEKYPKRSIDIIGILPNPEGSDSDNEYIIIKNNDKKTIDLSDWSIATGSAKSKLTNHPFTKSITIKKGEEKIIYNKYSNFSLPNQEGFVELRQPDGQIADKISYTKEKSIGENEIYKLDNNKKWIWENQPLIAKDEAEEKEGEKEETKFEDLSQEEKAEITAKIKEELKEELYNELVAKFKEDSEKNQAVLGEETAEKKTAENSKAILEMKKALKNGYLEFRLFLDNLLN